LINKLFFKTLFVIISAFLINPCFAYDYYEAGKIAYKENDYYQAGIYFRKALKNFPNHTRCRYYYAQSLINLKDFQNAQKEYEKIIETAPQSYEAKLASLGISEIQKYVLIKKGKYNYPDNNNDKSKTKLTVNSVGDNYIANAVEGSDVTRWHSGKMPIKLYIAKSVEVEGYQDFYYAEVKRAVNEWVNSVDGDILSCKLVEDPTEANIQVYFVSEIFKQTGKTYVAGLATPHVKGHILQYYDIKLATQRPPDNRTFTKNEIYQTILHEFGHALGIRGHSSDKNDIMYSAVESNPQDTPKKLSQRDINTLTLLYTLDPDISNFDADETVKKNSAKNEKILGSKDKRLNAKLEEAVEYTEKYPNNVLSWAQLGKAYFDLQKYENAIVSYKKALQIDPAYINALENLAFSYKEMGQPDEASEQFEKLVKIEPDNINYSYNYALFLIENKKYNKAKEVLNALKLINPKADANSDITKLTDYLSGI